MPDAPPDDSRPGPLVPVLLAWAIPGAGHFRIGRPWPALFIAGAVLSLFFGGMVLAGGENVSLGRHPWYFVAHAGASLPAVAASFLTEGLQLTERPPHQSVGQLFTSMAGLLNLVAIADCWARCKRGDPEDVQTDGTEPTPDEQPVGLTAPPAAESTGMQPTGAPGPAGPTPETPLG